MTTSRTLANKNMTSCKICNETIAKIAKVCPRCGGRLRMHGGAYFLLMFVSTLAVTLSFLALFFVVLDKMNGF